MTFDILSLFPQALSAYYDASILGRAQKKGIISIANHDIRDWATDKHRRVDDTPYGGGPGMVIRVDVVHRALKALCRRKNKKTRIILLTPRGKIFDQRVANRLAKYERLILIAGRYEAIDARIDRYVDETISLGNFILTGGELAAACVVDAVARLVPGVLGDPESLTSESFSTLAYDALEVEYPQYTRPEVRFVLRGAILAVMAGILSGLAIYFHQLLLYVRTLYEVPVDNAIFFTFNTLIVLLRTLVYVTT